jgi:hypothetical protein
LAGANRRRNTSNSINPALMLRLRLALLTSAVCRSLSPRRRRHRPRRRSTFRSRNSRCRMDSPWCSHRIGRRRSWPSK